MIILPSLSACGPGDAEATAKRFVNEMRYATRTPPDERLFELLDASARAELTRRAQAMSPVMGRTLNGWEVLRVAGFASADGHKGLSLSRLEEGRAVFSWEAKRLIATPGAEQGAAAESAELTLIQEEGKWRVSLPSLANGL